MLFKLLKCFCQNKFLNIVQFLKDVLKLYFYVGNTSFNGLLNDFKGFLVSIKCVILFSLNII